MGKENRSQKCFMVKITIGTTPILSHLTVIAKETQMFRKAGLDVDFRNFFVGKKCMHALQKGWVDIANVIDANTAALAKETKHKVKLLTCSQIRTDGAILARTDRGISSPKTLTDKKIGYMRETSSHIFLIYFCKHHNINLDDLNLIPMRIDKMEEALLGGEIDACSIWQPYTTNTKIIAAQRNIPTATFANSDFFKLYCFLAANTKSIDKKSKEIEAVIRILQQAETFIKQNPDEAAVILAQSHNLSLSFYKDFQPFIRDSITPITKDALNKIALHMQLLGYDTGNDLENFIDISLNISYLNSTL